MGTCHIICHDVFGVQYQYPIFDIVCCTNTHNFIHSLIYKYKKTGDWVMFVKHPVKYHSVPMQSYQKMMSL